MRARYIPQNIPLLEKILIFLIFVLFCFTFCLSIRPSINHMYVCMQKVIYRSIDVLLYFLKLDCGYWVRYCGLSYLLVLFLPMYLFENLRSLWYYSPITRILVKVLQADGENTTTSSTVHHTNYEFKKETKLNQGIQYRIPSTWALVKRFGWSDIDICVAATHFVCHTVPIINSSPSTHQKKKKGERGDMRGRRRRCGVRYCTQCKERQKKRKVCFVDECACGCGERGGIS